ncbi:LysR family transcriptional regulator [Agarilytica rhodophyticola]|uniref:LysR family transcriptional regulator n=1 Tax=Agarilytica rhodophyticola TaxID=1737490 RepID=UPI001C201486|nr:LysR family transcriptional regulator [Agarilytica rhodophyticola]
MITIKQVRAFVAIAETQSFAEACGMVHLSQPALSIAIKNLETDLGGPLLARTTRTLSLTPEGEEFFPIAQRLLNDWDAAIEDIHNLFSMRRGTISIATMPSFACNLLPNILVKYHQQYPKINIRVQDVVAEKVVDMVRTGRVEIGISFDPDESEDLIFTPLFHDQFIAVIPPATFNKRKSLCWQDLLEQDFIALQRPSSIRILLEQTLEANNLAFSVAVETHQLATIGRMVASGLGVSAVPSLCQAQMQEMGAVCLPLQKPAISRQVGILTRRRYSLSIAAGALKDVIMEMWCKN